MNKFSFCAFLCAAFFLIACGDSNDAKLGSKKSSKPDTEYKSFREIPSCDEKLNGKKAHVADLELNLVCENGKWVEHRVDTSSHETRAFVAPSTVVKGTMKDSRDGQKYKTVTIGSQVWMAQNLNYESTDSFCYNDSAEYCAKYGRLYTWAAAMDSVGAWSTNGKGCGYDTTCTPTYPVRGVCPSGWHLPTRDEFENLVYAVGGFATFNKMLKSTSGWDKDQNGIDSYSFTAYSSGFRFLDGYYSEKKRRTCAFLEFYGTL